MTRHFLRDDDLNPAEQAEVLELALAHEGRTASADARSRAAGGRADLRQADPADPGLLHRRRRRARRLPDRRRRQPRPDRGARVDRGHRAGAGPAVRRDRVAHLRPVADRGDGRVRGSARWSTRSPTSSTPARCWPTCSRSEEHAASTGWPGSRCLPRRRGQQHGALLPARRRHRGHARADRCAGRASARTRRSWPTRERDRGRHRWLGRWSPTTRAARSPAPTSSPPTPGSRWARARRPTRREALFGPFRLNDALLGRAGRTRSCCTACPPTEARRSPPKSSTARSAWCGTRPRTACTPRRRSSPGCWSRTGVVT